MNQMIHANRCIFINSESRVSWKSGHGDVIRCSPSLFSLLSFCDEIPLDTIKSLPESSLKRHNYRNKKNASPRRAPLMH